MLFIYSPSLCWPLALHIGMLLFGWSDILRVVLVTSSYFSQILLFLLTAYCDSDWATYTITRRSVTGYFISFGSSVVSWKTKNSILVLLPKPNIVP